jgi:hypothetical protein
LRTRSAIGVTLVAHSCGKQDFGGRKTDQVKRLKGLDHENARLRKAVPDLTLDKPILEEAAKLPEGQRQRTSEPRPPP